MWLARALTSVLARLLKSEIFWIFLAGSGTFPLSVLCLLPSDTDCCNLNIKKVASTIFLLHVSMGGHVSKMKLLPLIDCPQPNKTLQTEIHH